MTRQERVIWAAGFFDGEGCILLPLKRRRRPSGHVYLFHCLMLSATQTIEAPIEILVELWGGRANPKKVYNERHRDQWIWRAYGNTARAALGEMLPYLIVKRAQAELAIEFQNRRYTPGCKGKTLAERDWDFDAASTMQFLKRV